MSQDPQSELRKELATLLRKGNAHAGFSDSIKDIPAAQRGMKPAGSPHSAWQLLEHLRIAQWDILEFSRNAKHQSPKWPEGYWSESEAPPDAAWDKSIQSFEHDLEAFVKLLETGDLYRPLPHTDGGQSLLREALTLADHNSYHLGQLVLLRKCLGNWQA